MADTETSELNQEQGTEQEQKKEQSFGNLLTALGASYLMYRMTRDKRAETIDSWKNDFVKEIRSQNPEIAQWYDRQPRLLRRLVSKQARNTYQANLNKQDHVRNYVTDLLDRTGTGIVRGETSSAQLYEIQTNLAQMHPEIAQFVSPQLLIEAQSSLSATYSPTLTKVEQKMSPTILHEKEQSEHLEAVRHLFISANAKNPHLDEKSTEHILEVLTDVVEKGDIYIDPLRHDQLGEIVHEAYQKNVGVRTKLSPEELEHLYTFTEHYRKEGALQERTQKLFTKKSSMPGPLEVRNTVFAGLQQDLLEKLTQEPELNQLLHSTPLHGETHEHFEERLKTASTTFQQAQLFSYDVASLKDNLFLQLEQTPGLNQARVLNDSYIQNLLQKYPYLKNTIEGARIFQLQMETARKHQEVYLENLKELPASALAHITAEEDAHYATKNFEAELNKQGLSEKEIQERTKIYAKAAQEALTQRANGKLQTGLYDGIKQRYEQQHTNTKEDEVALKQSTQPSMSHLSNRPFSIQDVLKLQDSQKRSIQSIAKKTVRQYTTEGSKTMQTAVRKLFSWLGNSINKTFSGILNTGADLMGRVFARSAFTSSTTGASNAVGQQALKFATQLATKIPIVRVVILAIAVLFLLVMFISMDTKTMLAAQPYDMQKTDTDVAISETGPTDALSPVPTIVQQPYVAPAESLQEIVQIAAQKTQVPVPLLLGISHVEAQGTWNYSKEDLAMYNNYGWWTAQGLTVAQIKKGYGYDTCTGYIPDDSQHKGEQAVKMNGTICVDYSDGTKSHVMGAMQFNILTWNGFANRIQQALNISREPDRRVLTDAFSGAGFFTKGRSGASSSTSWTIMEIIKAAAAYHTGGTKCTYAYGTHTGNYCNEVCIVYNQYSQQYGATPVDCSITRQY